MKNRVNPFRRSRILALSCAVLMLGGAGVFARSGGANFFKSTAAITRPEIKVALACTVARDDKQLALDKAGDVRPGELLTWTITSANDGTAAAHSYSVVGQIPKGASFVAGSATSVEGTTVTYSIDDGKTYSERPVVVERQADGSTKQVPASAAMYTQVRYEWADPLAADAQCAASYKVRVR